MPASTSQRRTKPKVRRNSDVINGANVQQYTSNGTYAQKWIAVKNADGSYTFQSALGNKVLDVSGGSSANGANVRLYQTNGSNAQRWVD